MGPHAFPREAMYEAYLWKCRGRDSVICVVERDGRYLYSVEEPPGRTQVPVRLMANKFFWPHLAACLAFWLGMDETPVLEQAMYEWLVSEGRI